MKLKLPEMVFFDFGGTLSASTCFDPVKAGKALYACADNPEACSEEKVIEIWTRVFADACGRPCAPNVPMEIPQMGTMARCALDICGLRTSISKLSLETAVQWQGEPWPMMPDADRLLDRLEELGIPTAVVSNFSISSETLKNRIDEMLPRNRFKFVITSSDYGYCKPSPMFFRAAFGKAGMGPDNCWYCGDSMTADVAGAFASGLFPVNIDTAAKTGAELITEERGTFLRVNAWRELLALLEG
ncbi:MAG: HAD-IA family hydrolase [Clostridia bacterium]|nr:HAD-IA family hydrolase [Clostridia bacterium]